MPSTTLRMKVTPRASLRARVAPHLGLTGATGAAGQGVPVGGTTGQVLRKLSGVDFSTAWETLVKADVGLDNVDNTSDANKPVSTLQAAADAAVQAASQPLNADLTALSGIGVTAAGIALLDDANAAAQLTTLGISAFVQTLLDDADANAFRTTLGAPSVTTIASGSFPAAAVLDITGIPATYRKLQLRVAGVSSDTATRKVQVQVSTDNGSSFIATNYVGAVADAVGSSSLSTAIASCQTALAAAGTANMIVDIENYQGGLYVTARMAGDDSAGNRFHGTGAYNGGTTAINAIRVLWNGSGSFDAGTYILYGIR